MAENDTLKLLRECDAGIKMGTNSINEVFEHIKSAELKNYLVDSKAEHQETGQKIKELLFRYGGEENDLSPVSKGMSWMKINTMLLIEDSDSTVAELITDGCNMGIKSINGFLNEYKCADDEAKDLAEKIIKLEEKLSDKMRTYL